MNTVFIILVNYGNWQDTIECCQSIENNNYADYEVIISDVANKNNSLENLRSFIQTKTRITILPIEENNGFAYANNKAIQYAVSTKNAEWFWLLNNDTTISRDALSVLVDTYIKNADEKKIGFLGSKILYYSNQDTIQTIGGQFNPKTGYSVLIGKNEKDREFKNELFKTDYVIGASMFFNKKLVDKIGLMPEDYFLYYEDIEWCISARENGFTNYTATHSIVYHKQGGSTGNKYDKKKAGNLNTRKYMYTSYKRLFRKKYPQQMKIAYIMLLKQAVGRIFRFKIKEALIIFQAIFS